MSDHFRELAYRIWGTCPGVPGEIADEWLDRDREFDDRDNGRDTDDESPDPAANDPEPPIKVPDPPDGEGGFTEPEIPKVGSRDAPGG